MFYFCPDFWLTLAMNIRTTVILPQSVVLGCAPQQRHVERQEAHLVPGTGESNIKAIREQSHAFDANSISSLFLTNFGTCVWRPLN